MIMRLRKAWAKAPWLLTGFALAFALTLFFAVQFVADAIYWNDPRHQDQPLAAWMTPGYIGLSWDIPRDVMHEMLPRPEDLRGRHRLDAIAAARGVDLGALIAEIEADIAAFREAQE